MSRDYVPQRYREMSDRAEQQRHVFGSKRCRCKLYTANAAGTCTLCMDEGKAKEGHGDRSRPGEPPAGD